MVMGDSMCPTLPGGAVLLVNYQRTRLHHGGLFVFACCDELMVKRARKVRRGVWEW